MKVVFAMARALGLALAIGIVVATAALAAPRSYPATGNVEVAFTPGDAVDNLIIAAIDGAQSEILVHAYTFTHRRIAQALVGAKRRGVAVTVLADREQARAVPQNVLPQLVAGGVEVWLDGNFQAAHNKVIVIDAALPRATTITGSYNLTLAAQRSNAENVVVLHDKVARAYRDNWQRLKAAAVPWSEGAIK
ncbi:MAG: phospholipase D family protein [Betaproteobacteria bacterium]|nr:MAG: phospholipase D family protein [Betaproteobacteria bacterium]